MWTIDVDGHVEESVQTWQYLEPAFHHRRPLPVIVPEDTVWGDWNGFWVIDTRIRDAGGTPVPGMKMAQQKGATQGSQEITDIGHRIDDLNTAGVAKQVLITSLFMMCTAEDVELEAALCRSYNTYMSTQCCKSGDRLYFAAVLPWRAPHHAVKELRRVKAMGGVASVFVRGMEWDLPLDHPLYRPIFEEAERLNLPIQMHTGRGSPTILRMFQGQPRPKYDFPLPPSTDGRPLIGPMLVKFGFNRLTEGGVMDDFPKLRLVVNEIGSEWLVSAMTDQQRMAKFAGKDYMKLFEDKRIYCAVEPDEDVDYLIRKFGEDWLVCSTDMPHHDGSRHASQEQEFRPILNDRQLQKILWDNPARLYNFTTPQPTSMPR